MKDGFYPLICYFTFSDSANGMIWQHHALPLTNPPRLPLRGVFRRVGHLLFCGDTLFYKKAQCITKKIIGLTLCNVFFVTIKCDLVRKALKNAEIAFKSCVINFNVGIINYFSN